MPDSVDPITMILTNGGTGLGGGAITAYILTKVLGKNNNTEDQTVEQLKSLGQKIDNTNELLNELLRSQAKLECVLHNINQRN